MIRNLFGRAFSCTNQVATKKMSSDRFVWVDLEMTGLELEKHVILEIACIITTPKLEAVHDGIHLVIHQPEEKLTSMNSWSEEHHAQTGLTEASRNSTISISSADTMVSDYICKYTEPDGIKYIAGNSVYMDKIFIDKYMPKVSNLLHYRIIDNSTIKTLCSHWYPDEISKMPKKKLVHRALDDIKESIEELRGYRESIFK